MDVEALKSDLRDIRIFCGRYFPFVVIPLSYMRIVATKSVLTAGVDEKGTLAINPDWWSKLDVEAKRFVAVHESLHVVLCHPFRSKGFDRLIYNIAADGKVNDGIRNASVSGIAYSYDDEVTLEKLSESLKIDVESLRKMSTEEIARELEHASVKIRVSHTEGEPKDILEGEVDGEVVQEGEPTVGKHKTKGELEREWKRILERARDFAKHAGTMPAGLERLVEEILEVKPPWHITLRFGLRNGQKQDVSFAYPNRRSDDLPGPVGYTYNVWCLVDTSGSIDEDQLRRFLGIVKHEARRGQCYVIAWDGDAYEILKADRPADVAKKVAPEMKGGGGTVVQPVLMRAYKFMKTGDAVIMLTDGDIRDKDEEETQEWFRKVSSKAGFAMIGYTRTPVDAPGFAVARLDFGSPS